MLKKKSNVTFHRKKNTKDIFKFVQASKKVRPHEFNQSNLRFLVKNTLLNNSHLERFNTVCPLFPMERHNSVLVLNNA